MTRGSYGSSCDFARETIPSYAKILVGMYGLKRWNGERRYGNSAKYRLEQLVGDLLPSFPPLWKECNTTKNGMGHCLVRRAAFSMPRSPQNPNGKDELKRFRNPDFQLAWDRCTEALEKQKVITLIDIAIITDTELTLKYDGHPGVYFRTDPEISHRLYLGDSSDVGGRSSGHTNSPLLLSHVIGTTESGHKFVQDCLIAAIENNLGGRPAYGRNTKGLYEFDKGINALEVIKNYIATEPIVKIIMRNFANIQN